MERVGIPVAPVLAACGMSRASLRNPFARVDAELDHRMWAALEEVSGDPAIGIKLGIDIARRGNRTVDMYIALYCGTLRDLFATVERFAKLSDDRGHLEVREADALATVRLYRDGGYPRADGYLEGLFAASVYNFRQRVPGFSLRQVRLRRPHPADPAPYLAAFGVMPVFGSATVELSFGRALLDVPMNGADVALAEVLKEYASELVRKIPAVDPLLYAVQTALADGLQRGQVSLATIARATGTSARTLRRRLSSIGTSFQEQLEKLRFDRAVQQLQIGQESVASIAEHLGFASTTAFQRAFRRWTGLTPSGYRQKERAARARMNGQADHFAYGRDQVASPRR